MEIWQKFNFTTEEYKTWEIYKAYELTIKKRGDYRKYLPASTDPRSGKNWKYFKEVYDNFDKDTTFEPYIFIEAQFRNIPKDKTIYPAQLKTKTAIKNYHDHRDAIKVVDVNDNTKKLIDNLIATFKFMKKWWKQNNLPLDSYLEFFNKEEGEMLSTGMYFCLQGMLSKYFMAVSKHFLREYIKLDPDMKWEILTPKDLRSYKIKLKLDIEAYDFAKTLFNGEIT